MDPSVQLLLWRWSTALQVASGVMIAGFFAVISMSTRRAEAKPWGWAWLCNVLALLVTAAYWFSPSLGSPLPPLLLSVGYFLGKTGFLVLLLLGARAFVHPTRKRLTTHGTLVVGLVVGFSVVAALSAGTIPRVGVIQSAVMALGCAAGMGILLRGRTHGSLGLVAGFGLRGLLGVIECVAYSMQVVGAPVGSSRGVAIFLATHSAMDTGAEWVIALGCVLTLYRHIQLELTSSNEELNRAHGVLQGLVDRDPLTGLANRRALPSMLRAAFDGGATMLFFDLNDFKEVNDTLGHHAGDACLQRFAQALREGFRPDDDVVRWAGDEFLVIAHAAEPDTLLRRVDDIRARLATPDAEAPAIRFSVGSAYMRPGGDAERTIEAADAAMYQAKAAGQGPGADGRTRS